MVMLNPKEVNELDDNVLSDRVEAVLECLAVERIPDMAAVHPFLTAGVLLRLHNMVQTKRRGGWSKQASLAMVVASFTGVRSLKNKEVAEHIGNAQDTFLRNHVIALKKVKQARATALSKAKRAGREPPAAALYDERIAALEEHVYKCQFGGVPRHVVVPGEEARQTSSAIRKQPVPFRRVEFADETNTLLKRELLEVSQRERDAIRERERDVARVTLQAEREVERSRRQAEKHVAEEAAARRAAEEGLEAARLEAKEAVRGLREQRRAAEEAEIEAAAKIARLGGQVAAAQFEVGAVMERERKARMQVQRSLQRAVAEETEARCAAEAAARQVGKELRREKRAGERASAQAEAKIARLGGQVAAAHRDAGMMVDREKGAREKAEHVVTAELEARLATEERARELATQLRQEKRAAEQMAHDTEAKVARLGGQVAAAYLEAACAVEREEKAKRKIEELRRLVEEKEQIAQHLRELKAHMARKKRDAEAKAGTVHAIELQLQETRRKYRQLRVEANAMRASMCCADEDVSASESEAESETASEDDPSVAVEQEREQAVQNMKSMPTWRYVHEKRGGGKLEWGTRVVVYTMLALLVPPSAIGAVIVLIVKRTAHWLNPVAPSYETIARCRFELRFVEEALSARRIASAHRVRGIGFDETTKLGLSALTSNVTIEPTEGAPLEDVITRAAYCPMGGTAELVVESIKEKCFARMRDLLRRWKAHFHELYPDETWTGPDPCRCSLSRLGGGGAIIGDTCSTAQSTKRKLADAIAEAVKESVDPEVWEALTDEQRNCKTRTHQQDCWQHLRNIFLAEMSKAMASHVAEELKPELDTFSAWERISTEFTQLLRAAYKEFHHGCRYYKGKGREYQVWLADHHPTDFVLHLERAEGGRQDLDFDAAIPLYVNRKYMVQYLHGSVFKKGHCNILEDFLYVTFRSLQFIAMVRANALIDIHISRPLRWLSGKSKELRDWSPVSMGEPLDLVHDFFERAQLDGSLFLDPSLDIFKPIAEKQPLFAEWRAFNMNEDHVYSPDGSTKHLHMKKVAAELVQPSDATNVRSRAKTIEYLELQCRAALKKMHDPKLALRDKLTSQDGKNAVGNAKQQHEDTLGCHATNDVLAESVFGTYDMVLKRFGSISMEAASGVAQAVRSCMLSLGDFVAHRKQSTKKEVKPYEGYFHKMLPEKEQEALVDLARLTVKEFRDIDRADHTALDEYHKERRKANEEDAVSALFTRYALAISFFERWVKRGVQNDGEITAALRGYGPDGEREQEKLDWCREQIEMRVVGLSWTDWATPWSSSKDENIGTLPQLVSHLKEVLKEEKSLQQRGELPSKQRARKDASALADECPAPQFQRRTFKALGTPTAQAEELAKDSIRLSPEEVLDAAQARRKELEDAGEIDWVSDRQPYPTGQGPVPGKDLVGKTLEVRWRYRHTETGKPVYIWCEGVVENVADGEKDKETARCKKILPAGVVQIRWAADIEYDEEETLVWSVLKPAGFNKDVHLGWRFAACELKRMEAAKEAQRAKTAKSGRAKLSAKRGGQKK